MSPHTEKAPDVPASEAHSEKICSAADFGKHHTPRGLLAQVERGAFIIEIAVVTGGWGLMVVQIVRKILADGGFA
ncbi:hypothetical protein [Methylobacterium sp. ARG-1]|uniref:hypothetical protein n=1 Tax=Methylobacterium sp. ARG-1 TaxID=1692501 RepID=UPI000A3FD5EC|nr:hypothetical protein [Methylobacterium sp. ARG-1]